MTKIKTARTAEGEKFYYLGHTQAVVDDNGNNIEDLLAEQEEKIELLNDNTGVSDYPEFSTSKTYKTGTIVRHEGALFKFTSDHEPGIWDLEEVKSWSINAESQEKLSELGSEVGALLSNNLSIKIDVKGLKSMGYYSMANGAYKGENESYRSGVYTIEGNRYIIADFQGENENFGVLFFGENNEFISSILCIKNNSGLHNIPPSAKTMVVQLYVGYSDTTIYVLKGECGLVFEVKKELESKNEELKDDVFSTIDKQITPIIGGVGETRKYGTSYFDEQKRYSMNDGSLIEEYSESFRSKELKVGLANRINASFGGENASFGIIVYDSNGLFLFSHGASETLNFELPISAYKIVVQNYVGWSSSEISLITENKKGRLVDVEEDVNEIREEINGFQFDEKGFYQQSSINNAVEETVRTGLIRVNEGDIFYYSGGFSNTNALSLIWGYTSESLEGGISLLYSEEQIIHRKVSIPSGVNYIGAWSKSSTKHSLTKEGSISSRVSAVESSGIARKNILYYDSTKGSFRKLIESITDSSKNNTYEIRIAEGVYELRGDITDAELSGDTFRGISIPNYVKLVGVNGMEKTKFILTLENKHNIISTFNLLADCELEGLTVEGVKTRYAVHDDQVSNSIGREYYRNVKNCRFIATDCAYNNAYGAGLRGSAKWHFENCIFESNGTEALLIHDNVDFYGQAEVTLVNCTAKATGDAAGSMVFRSLARDNEKTSARIHLYGCKTNGYSLTISSSADYGKTYKMEIDGCGNSINVPITSTTGYIPNFSDLEVGRVLVNNGVLKFWNGIEWEALQ